MLKMFSVLFLLFAYSSQANLAEGIINKYFVAIGGAENINAIENMELKATSWSPMTNSEDEVTMKFKGEKAFYVEQMLQGKNHIFVHDGTSGWALAPMMQMNELTQMPAEMVPNLKAQFDQVIRLVKGVFVNYQEKGLTLEFLGKEEDGGKTLNKISIKDPADTQNAQQMFAFFDKSTNLISKIEIVTSQGTVKILFKDFKKYGNTTHPTMVETIMNGQTISKLTVKNFNTSPKFDANTFAKPKL